MMTLCGIVIMVVSNVGVAFVSETPCICTVDGDPRVTTFDGSALLIDGVGIYLLLETELPERGQRFLLAVEAAQVAPGKYPGLLSIVRIYFKAENQLTMVENNSIRVYVVCLPSYYDALIIIISRSISQEGSLSRKFI